MTQKIALIVALTAVMAHFGYVPAADIELNPIERIAGIGAGRGGNVGQYAQLAHDRTGGQYVVYYDATFGELKYAHRPNVASEWYIDVVDDAGDVGRWCSLSVPDNHIFLQGQGDINNGSNLVVNVVGLGLQPAVIGGRFKFDLDGTWYRIVDLVEPNNILLDRPWESVGVNLGIYSIEYFQPAIAYQASGTSRSLKVARRVDRGNWLRDTIDSAKITPGATSTGYYTSIDHDTFSLFETIHLSYQDQSIIDSQSGRLRYARFGGATWTRDTPDTITQRGAYSRLVMDDGIDSDTPGEPTVFYKDDANQDMRAIRYLKDFSVWSPAFTKFDGNIGNAIDAKYFAEGDRVVFTYQDAPTTVTEPGKIYYGSLFRTLLSRGGGSELVAEGPGWGAYTTVAHGPTTGTQAIAFYDALNKNLLMTRYQGTPTTYTTPVALDVGEDVGRFCSADFNPADDELYCVYYDAGRQALKMANFDGATTSTEVIDGLKFGTYSDIVVTESEVLVAYHDDIGGTVRLARWPVGGLPSDGADELIDATSEDVGEYVSMVVDPFDRIYMVYYDRANTNLRAAIWNGTQWFLFQIVGESQPIDPQQNVGEYCRLAINPDGTRLGLLFYDADRQRLFLAEADVPPEDATDIVIPFTGNPPEFGHKAGRFCSMTYDDTNRIHLAFFDDDLLSPVYMVSDNGITSPREVIEQDLFLASGWYTSIAINPVTGQPGIAYYDITHSALKYAERDAGGDWTIETIDDVGETGWYPVLRFDPLRSQQYIVYHNDTNGELRLAARVIGRSRWPSPWVLADGTSGIRPSLTLDSEGRLYMSFHQLRTGDLLTLATSVAPEFNPAGPSWLYYR